MLKRYMKMFQKGFIKRSAKESKAVSKEYWQQEYHWHEQVESEEWECNTQKCGVSWCDVYDMTPWKSQCSYQGTGKCGAEAGYETRNQWEKYKAMRGE